MLQIVPTRYTAAHNLHATIDSSSHIPLYTECTPATMWSPVAMAQWQQQGGHQEHTLSLMNSAYLSASTTEPVAIIRREEEVDIILKQLLLPTRDIPSTVAAPTTTPKSLVRIPLYAILA